MHERPADGEPGKFHMNDSSTRRQFLKAASGAMVAAPAIAAAGAEPRMAADHRHSCPPLGPGSVPAILAGTRLGLASQLRRRGLSASVRGAEVVKAVYMEVDVDPAQQEQEARTVAELCRRGKACPRPP